MIASIGTASAFQTGYSNLSYWLANAVTWDGKWTSATEWVDAMPSNFGTNAAFREKFDLVTEGETYIVFYDTIIESWDNTNDAGDYYEICIDGLMDGGTAPKVDDYKVNIYGHAPTATVQWYKGTGTGWANTTTPAGFVWGEALASSPTTSANHYSAELKVPKSGIGAGAEIWVRVAYYDAHAGGYGLQAWPPTSANTPDAWGDIPYTTEAIPEGFNFGILAVLSSIAVVAGAICIRKMAVPKFGKL